tara:strand:+ start:7221 stop:10736 length:3516 start_codon:yes stop_codon:yes gene_type:complete
MKLEEVTRGARISGLSPAGGEAEIRAVDWLGPDRLQVTFKDRSGLQERVIDRTDEHRLDSAERVTPFSFTAKAEDFKVAAEARRIDLAHLFDPYLALTSSAIEPLPHQITAVYGSMLERQPLRFLLADDPGAGKTIMAGLYIKELMLRGDLKRCLIVAPGSLVDQWQDELQEKFALDFRIITRSMIDTSYSGNPFVDHDRIILRLDMASRSEDIQALIETSDDFDLVIADEAHRMSASYTGGEVKYTKRFQLGRKLAEHARHFLLMTATPHNGKDEDFQLFLSLLDADRFEGAHRDGTRMAKATDLMRRAIKEDLYWFDGRPLFPERFAQTVSYPLSPAEADLYESVTEYVREEMNRVQRFASDEKKRLSVGFALMALQRRLASSPRAIWRSLRRRREKLQSQLDELKIGVRARGFDPDDLPPEADLDEMGGEELAELEDNAIEGVSVAASMEELAREIETLTELEERAHALCQSGEDAKWRQLATILNEPPVYDEDAGRQKKILIFTEPRDTLDYLQERIASHLGNPDAVAVIHGGVTRQQRRAIVARFNDDPSLRVLLANDAAGEGVNLQRGAHLMVNYDLPWNPNRLEQRFGRIHRIGQTEVCYLWNLVAGETREGAIYQRLLEKLEAARQQLGGKVFDVVGEAFEGRPLRELLFEAVLYNEKPEVRQRLYETVDGAVDTESLRALTTRAQLAEEAINPAGVEALRHEMERAQAQRLQPHYVRAFFMEAMNRVGGHIAPREPGRWEVIRVPARVRLADQLAGSGDPVLERYERIAFDKANVRGAEEGDTNAAFMAPGHPLLAALTGMMHESLSGALSAGAVLVSDDDRYDSPQLLAMLHHKVHDEVPTADGRMRSISEEIQFVTIAPDGTTSDAGAAPYLDMRPATEDEQKRIEELKEADWLKDDLLQKVRRHAGETLAASHTERVRARRLAHLDKIEEQVRLRLSKDTRYWAGRAAKYEQDIRAGKDKVLAKRQAEERAQRSAERLEQRISALKRERAIHGGATEVIGGALIIPAHLLADPHGVKPSAFAEDSAKGEAIGMEAVMASERAAGRKPEDVSKHNRGWDIESVTPDGTLIFIEVKARARGADTLFMTRNEILQAKNAGPAYHLAIVMHENGWADPPQYVSNPGPGFGDPGEFGDTHHAYPLRKLLANASTQPQIVATRAG